MENPSEITLLNGIHNYRLIYKKQKEYVFMKTSKMYKV